MITATNGGNGLKLELEIDISEFTGAAGVTADHIRSQAIAKLAKEVQEILQMASEKAYTPEAIDAAVAAQQEKLSKLVAERKAKLTKIAGLLDVASDKAAEERAAAERELEARFPKAIGKKP